VIDSGRLQPGKAVENVKASAGGASGEDPAEWFRAEAKT